MSAFSAAWLSLREPADARAAAAVLAVRLRRQLRPPLHILDLGAGTGALLRQLAPRLPRPQLWRLVERDPALVAAGRRRLARLPSGVRAVWVEADLRAGLGPHLEPPPQLITASALLDLVSEAWLAELAAALRALGGTAFYARLTFDGRIRFAPPHPWDARIARLLCAHQRRDKGFGPALGPRAWLWLAHHLPGLCTVSSPWRLGPEAGELQRRLIRAWARAAAEQAPGEGDGIAAWCRFRLRALARGEGRLWVGHRDQLWLPRSGARPHPVAAA